MLGNGTQHIWLPNIYVIQHIAPNIYACHPTYIPNIYTQHIWMLPNTLLPNRHSQHIYFVTQHICMYPTHYPMLPNVKGIYMLDDKYICWVTYMLDDIYVGYICWVTLTPYMLGICVG